MGSTLVTTGEKVACDDTMHVFVHGAYNLGPILWNREIETAAIHPGEGVEMDRGAGGEDSVTLHTDASRAPWGVCELDEAQIADCSVDYATGDDVPIIVYHMNIGAILRNIVCVDPGGAIEPSTPLFTNSGTAGAFIAQIADDTFVDSDTADGEAFSAGTLSTSLTAQIIDRAPLKQYYYLADPNDAYDTVAYICRS